VHITNRVICQGKIYFVTECDRPYALTHSKQRNRVFYRICGIQRSIIVKNPVSGPLCDRPFTPKSDRTFSPSLFYNLLLSPALKVFEVREAKLSPRESPSTQIASTPSYFQRFSLLIPSRHSISSIMSNIRRLKPQNN